VSWILVVDDDDDVRNVIATLLGLHGYDVVEAENGRAALAHIAERGLPSLILLDLRMPGMSGEELLDALRARSEAAERPRPPVVVLSGEMELGGRADTLLADATLSKPVELSELLATVARLVDGGADAPRPA
jgi:CheY-like chemotaxis protein